MVQWSFFLIEPPEAKTMGAIAQNESPEAKTMGAIVQKGQNHGSYRSKRSPRGHLDEAPMEMGFPKPFVVPLKKSKKYQVIFPRQNVVNFNTKLITFWPIA